jgi:Fe-S oxidoreductase
VLGLRDELPKLVQGSEAATLAKASFTFEEFIARERSAGRWTLAFKRSPYRRALVHGHCHQKSFGVLPSVMSTLQLVPELTVEAIPSSCCGMAGAFGYQAENLAVSLRMAEANLLPAVRAAGADTVVVADGTSCRHQIHDGAAREAAHVAVVLAAAL